MNSEAIRRLLGTELAQNDPNYLTYSVPRTDLLSKLRSFDNRLCIINAARGSGKSALLINCKDEIRRVYPNDVIIHKFYSDIQFPPDDTGVNHYVAFWKNTLLAWIVAEIGKRKGIAFSDSDISAVEIAEKLGVKERNIVGSLLKRIKFKGLPIDKLDYDPEITDDLFSRLSSGISYHFWLLLDEMDDHYSEARVNCLIGLMQAAQHLTQKHQGIFIRLTIRPHILTLLRKKDDVIQTFRSQELQVYWSVQQLEELLAYRVYVYEGLHQASQLSLLPDTPYTTSKSQKRRDLISRYFEDFDVSFAEHKTSQYRALFTVSFYRPRWLIEYCSRALELAETNYATRTDFQLALELFGSNRVVDLCGEHRNHISHLEEITNCLLGTRKVSYGTSQDLKELIIDKVIRAGAYPLLKGLDDSPHNLDEVLSNAALKIADQLYMIEFIRPHQRAGGRDDHRFYRYQERPTLLKSWNGDQKITWQLHPTYSKSMNIEDSGVYRNEGEVRRFGSHRKKRELREQVDEE